MFGFSVRRYAITLLIARGLRYAFWAAMGAFYGDEALDWLERFDAWFAERGPMLLMGILAVVVAALVVYAARQGRARPGAGEA